MEILATTFATHVNLVQVVLQNSALNTQQNFRTDSDEKSSLKATTGVKISFLCFTLNKNAVFCFPAHALAIFGKTSIPFMPIQRSLEKNRFEHTLIQYWLFYSSFQPKQKFPCLLQTMNDYSYSSQLYTLIHRVLFCLKCKCRDRSH